MSQTQRIAGVCTPGTVLDPWSSRRAFGQRETVACLVAADAPDAASSSERDARVCPAFPEPVGIPFPRARVQQEAEVAWRKTPGRSARPAGLRPIRLLPVCQSERMRIGRVAEADRRGGSAFHQEGFPADIGAARTPRPAGGEAVSASPPGSEPDGSADLHASEELSDQPTSPLAALPATASSAHHRRRELVSGALAALPFAIGIAPFLITFGILAQEARLSLPLALALGSLVFSGALPVAAKLYLAGTPGGFILLAGVILNLRHLLYGAKMSPHLKRLPILARLVLSHLLADEVFTLTATHYAQPGSHRYRQWFLVGAGLSLLLATEAGTLIGSVLGAQVGALSLDFTPMLGFIALLLLVVQDRASLGAALIAGLVAVLAAAFPFDLGLLLAILAGVGTGWVLQVWTGPKPSRQEEAYASVADSQRDWSGDARHESRRARLRAAMDHSPSARPRLGLCDSGGRERAGHDRAVPSGGAAAASDLHLPTARWSDRRRAGLGQLTQPAPVAVSAANHDWRGVEQPLAAPTAPLVSVAVSTRAPARQRAETRIPDPSPARRDI